MPELLIHPTLRCLINGGGQNKRGESEIFVKFNKRMVRGGGQNKREEEGGGGGGSEFQNIR